MDSFIVRTISAVFPSRLRLRQPQPPTVGATGGAAAATAAGTPSPVRRSRLVKRNSPGRKASPAGSQPVLPGTQRLPVELSPQVVPHQLGRQHDGCDDEQEVEPTQRIELDATQSLPPSQDSDAVAPTQRIPAAEGSGDIDGTQALTYTPPIPPSPGAPNSRGLKRAASDSAVHCSPAKVVATAAEDLVCFVCGETLITMTNHARQTHVNACLDNSNRCDTEVAGTEQVCAVCGEDLAELDAFDRQLHVNTCLAARSSSNSDSSTPASALSNAFSVLMGASHRSKPASGRSTPSGSTAAAQAQAQTSTGPASGRIDAMSLLMASAKTLAPSASAPAAESSGGSEYQPAVTRPMPWFKKMPGTPFVVDAFCYTDQANYRHFVLTHFHSDHYGGLSRKFSDGLIYCTAITGALVQAKLGVKPEFIRVMPMNEPTVIAGIELTFLDANHCPGAAMVLFRLPSGQTYLHVGDFRWDERMTNFPHLRTVAGSLRTAAKLDTLYLDTTYCDPKYDFPAQAAAIQAVVNCVKEHASKPDVVFIFGSYSIGKERLYMEAARELDEKVYVSRNQFETLLCFGWPAEFTSRLTTSTDNCRIRVMPMFHLSMARLEEMMKADGKLKQIVAFKPTGWTYRGTAAAAGCNQVIAADGSLSTSAHSTLLSLKTGGHGKIWLYSVPYSEHSSFSELQRCVEFLDPIKIIPTVNSYNAAQARAMVASLRPQLQ